MAFDDGTFRKAAMPTMRRENWSTATATHQQNGQYWGRANGSQAVHRPEKMGTAVMSMCQT